MLFHLARMRTPSIDPVIVELGAWRGKTSLLLAAGLCGKVGARLVVAQRAGAEEAQSDQQTLHRNLHRCRLGHMLKTTVEDRNWTEGIDILFVNGPADPSQWSPFVKMGGIVILHGVSPEVAENLQPPIFGEFRRVENLAWAVKQCAASMGNSNAAVDPIQYLLSRSTEAMLHLNPIPGALEEQLPHQDARIQRLEDTTEVAIARLQDYVRRAANELAEDRHAVQALHRSWSWRLTAPLRRSIEMLQASIGLLTSFRDGSPKARCKGLAQWILFGRQVRASGLLDERYYRDRYRDAAWARSSPLLHFLVRGASEGNNPNELFDIGYYLGCYPDVAQSGVNPLVHYLRNGADEGRNPHPYFNSSFYLEQNPDVREDGLNPLAHYLAPGIAEGRDPNPWFDTSEYLERNPDVAMFGLNPLVHCAEGTLQGLCSR